MRNAFPMVIKLECYNIGNWMVVCEGIWDAMHMRRKTWLGRHPSFGGNFSITFPSTGLDLPGPEWSLHLHPCPLFHVPASSSVGFVSSSPICWAYSCLAVVVPAPKTLFHYLSTTSLSHSSDSSSNNISSGQPTLTTQPVLPTQPPAGTSLFWFFTAFVLI